MDERKFAEALERASAWVARYFEHTRDFPVFSQVRPGEVAAAMSSAMPEEGEDFDALLDDFERIVVPGITHWNHPRFFAYFATSSAPAAILAEALSATLDVKVMLWRTSPAATELEDVVMRWLGTLLGVDPSWKGIIYDT